MCVGGGGVGGVGVGILLGQGVRCEFSKTEVIMAKFKRGCIV